MPRLTHGEQITTAAVHDADAAMREGSAGISLGFALGPSVDLNRFGFLFPALQADPDNLLPEDPTTPGRLVDLGRTMRDPGPTQPDPGDSDIPAAYTYLGQFIDHDITLEAVSAAIPQLLDPALAPMTVPAITSTLHNLRTATLDLDNLYGPPAPRDGTDPAKLALGVVASTGSTSPPFARPAGKDDDNDVPREPRSNDHVHDRAALIGDPRDDENLIIAQLQVAFLKAHNVLAAQGRSFEEARTVLRQHYQHIVVHDFLMRVADPAIVTDIVENGPKAYDPPGNNVFMPLEFAVAGYRFGHTMIRSAYNFNVNFNLAAIPASLDLLFTFTALSGQLGDFDTLPENWIIEWERVVDAGSIFDRTRRIDTKLVEPLFDLRDVQGSTEPGDGARLAVRNLLRGYLLRMPTGQAVAAALGLPVLSGAEIEAAAASPEQVQALRDGDFLSRTPLWYYVLAEAASGGGMRLGPVGSTLVADVLVGLARRSQSSIFDVDDWQPSLPSAVPGTFELRDLLSFAGVLPDVDTEPQPEPLTYQVVAGDTLFSIAASELGDGSRWPQIFALNRDQVGDPALIFVGQILRLPDPDSTAPTPQVYRVRRGDSLSRIARNQLGDANRWPEIFEMNLTVINNPSRIFPGQVLLLPAS